MTDIPLATVADLGDYVQSASGSTGVPAITGLVSITQADYDLLDPPDAATFYVIVED